MGQGDTGRVREDGAPGREGGYFPTLDTPPDRADRLLAEGHMRAIADESRATRGLPPIYSLESAISQEE